MALVIEQAATPLISNAADQDLVWGSTPTEDNLVVVVFLFDSSKTITEPTAKVKSGFTVRVTAADIGGDSTRDLRIETGIVAASATSPWNWDYNTSGIIGIAGIEVSGADIDGALKTESIVDTGSPFSSGPLDGDSDPSGSYLYVAGAGTKGFTGQVGDITADDGFTHQGSDSSETGTNWILGMLTKILTGTTRPGVTLTTDKATQNETGVGMLLGIPETAAAAAVYPPFPRRQLTTVRM